MGDDGWNAMLARAFARAEVSHPALKNIRRFNEGRIHLDDVAASVEALGVAEATAAIEALLAGIVDVLSQLIGEDMVVRLIEPEAESRKGGGAHAP